MHFTNQKALNYAYLSTSTVLIKTVYFVTMGFYYWHTLQGAFSVYLLQWIKQLYVLKQINTAIENQFVIYFVDFLFLDFSVVQQKTFTEQMATKSRPVVAAIDFGTTYSGYAYALRDIFATDKTKVNSEQVYVYKIKDARSIFLYPYNQSPILQYVKYTK